MKMLNSKLTTPIHTITESYGMSIADYNFLRDILPRNTLFYLSDKPEVNWFVIYAPYVNYYINPLRCNRNEFRYLISHFIYDNKVEMIIDVDNFKTVKWIDVDKKLMKEWLNSYDIKLNEMRGIQW